MKRSIFLIILSFVFATVNGKEDNSIDQALGHKFSKRVVDHILAEFEKKYKNNKMVKAILTRAVDDVKKAKIKSDTRLRTYFNVKLTTKDNDETKNLILLTMDDIIPLDLNKDLVEEYKDQVVKIFCECDYITLALGSALFDPLDTKEEADKLYAILKVLKDKGVTHKGSHAMEYNFVTLFEQTNSELATFISEKSKYTKKIAKLFA